MELVKKDEAISSGQGVALFLASANIFPIEPSAL